MWLDEYNFWEVDSHTLYFLRKVGIYREHGGVIKFSVEDFTIESSITNLHSSSFFKAFNVRLHTTVSLVLLCWIAQFHRLTVPIYLDSMDILYSDQ